MKRIITAVLYGLGIIAAISTLALIALIIYYWPVIDRLYIRPCHYYPKAFIDCREKE